MTPSDSGRAAEGSRRRPSRSASDRQGALNFVIVGAGATGVETAGAFADAIDRLIRRGWAKRNPEGAGLSWLTLHRTCWRSSRTASTSTQDVLEAAGCSARARYEGDRGSPDRVVSLGRARDPDAQSGVGGWNKGWWCGARGGLPQAASGRLEVGPDLSVAGFPRVYAIGDVANTLAPDGKPIPQLGSVALAGRTVRAPTTFSPRSRGSERQPFQYHDKGIMAMIGRNAAVAEIGRASTRTARCGCLRVMAWGACVVAQRHARAIRATGSWGVGLRRHEARVGVHQPS